MSHSCRDSVLQVPAKESQDSQGLELVQVDLFQRSRNSSDSGKELLKIIISELSAHSGNRPNRLLNYGIVREQMGGGGGGGGHSLIVAINSTRKIAVTRKNSHGAAKGTARRQPKDSRGTAKGHPENSQTMAA